MALTDKVAVITGATGQLGPVVARLFAGAGSKLALIGTSEDELAALVSDLGFPESRIFTMVRDVMDDAAAQSAADAVISRFGRTDILLPLIGGYQSSSLLGMEMETWNYMLNLNLRTAMNAMRAFLPYLIANGWGRIITLSSILADFPTAHSAAYSAAKAGVEALTLAVAQEVKEKGVTANVIVVKVIDSQEERAKNPTVKSAGWTKAEEIAQVMLFLCSDEAGAINGARIPVYGRG